MNKEEALEKLKNAGIYQLNKGETLADALSSVENKTARKGYRYRHDDGALMTKSQVIANENKQAFSRSFTPASYNHDECEYEDCSNDLREDKNNRGMLANCFYCGTAIIVDGGDCKEYDYSVFEDTTHCDECMNDAVMRLCM